MEEAGIAVMQEVRKSETSIETKIIMVIEQNKIRNAIESLTPDQKFKYLTENLADFEKKNLTSF